MRIKHLRFRAAAALAVLAAAAWGCADGGDDDAPPVTAAASAGDTVPADPDDAGVAPATTAASETTVATTTAAPTTTTTPTTTPTTTAPVVSWPQSPPYRAELPSGVFVLADRIAQKLTLDQTLSVVLSVAGPSGEGSGPAMGAGVHVGAAETSERHGAGVEARTVGADGADQAAQIDDLVVSGEVDCLVVEPPADDPSAAQAVARAMDRAVNAGVPVFTVGGDSADSRRFAFYGLDELSAGRLTGSVVGRWAVEGRILLRKAGVLAGDAASEESQQLMEGFVAGITAELPDIEFVNGPGDVESFGSEYFEFYDEAGEWILAHPDVDIIFVTGAGLEPAAAFIADRALYGDVSLAGFDMSETVRDYIYEGVVVAAMVPGAANQAAAAAQACGDFLLAGVYDTGAVAVDPVAVTDDNLDERDWTLPENR